MVSMSSEPANFTKILAAPSLEKQVDFYNKIRHSNKVIFRKYGRNS